MTMRKIALFAFGIALIGIFALSPVFVFAQGEGASEQERIDDLRATVAQLLKRIVELQLQLVAALRAPMMPAGQEIAPSVSLCGQAEIAWERVSGANAYALYRNGFEMYSGKNLKFTDTGLAPGATYAYTVRARNAGGLGSASPVKTVTIPSQCPPSAPFVQTQEGICGGSVRVSWSQVPGASFYEVFRGNTRVFGTNAVSFLDRGLSAGRSYAYKVRAGNIGGWGEFSPETSAKASAICPPAAPRAPVAEVPLFETAAQEGIVKLSIQKTPSGVTAQSGKGGVTILSFRVSAEHSPIVVERVDVEFSDRPWLFLSTVELRDGSRQIASIEASENAFARIAGSVYFMRFGNVALEIPEGKSKTLSVRVVAKEHLSLSSPRELSVSIPANGVRARDQIDIMHVGPGSQESGVFAKPFFVKR